jgi:enoyl-CoA hydratase
MTFETLSCVRHDDGCLVVTLDRPEVRNAINTRMGQELRELFVPLKFTPGDLRCIVLTGAGDKSFCSGGDLKERKEMADSAWQLQHAIFEEAFYAVMECPVPVLAAVNGTAYAGGCELALACDFIYAASTATFALRETSLGIIPGCGGTQNLSRAVGERRAKELILTARPFTAAQALEWGAVNEVVAPEHLMERTLAVAHAICANAPLAVVQAKKAIHNGLQSDLRTGLTIEIECYARTIPSEDRREGILAFNEKRAPVFRGR